MPTPLERLLQLSADDNPYAAQSRYRSVTIRTLTLADGREVRYAGRRFVPAPASAPSSSHVVTVGERIDHLAHRYLGNPEQFWVLCDHNLVMRPWELVAEPGARIVVDRDGATFVALPAPIGHG